MASKTTYMERIFVRDAGGILASAFCSYRISSLSRSYRMALFACNGAAEGVQRQKEYQKKGGKKGRQSVATKNRAFEHTGKSGHGNILQAEGKTNLARSQKGERALPRSFIYST